VSPSDTHRGAIRDRQRSGKNNSALTAFRSSAPRYVAPQTRRPRTARIRLIVFVDHYIRNNSLDKSTRGRHN
jgi:hypothetical protein